MKPGPPWSAFGAGKVILLGEHAVVYGEPALAAPLPMGVSATGTPASRLDVAPMKGLKGARRALLMQALERAGGLVGHPGVRVKLVSDLPLSMGLGSSAAVSVACARVLLQAAGKPETVSHSRVLELAVAMEEVFHGKSSGVDHTTSVEGCAIRYVRKPGTAKGRARRLVVRTRLPLVLAFAGDRGMTQETVGRLRERAAIWPERYRRLFREIGKVVEEGVAAVEAGDLDALGDAMNVNQGLLSALGVSSPSLETCIHELRSAGALGAKLTGAGGSGGAVLALFARTAPAIRRLRRRGLPCFPVELPATEAE